MNKIKYTLAALALAATAGSVSAQDAAPANAGAGLGGLATEAGITVGIVLAATLAVAVDGPSASTTSTQ